MTAEPRGTILLTRERDPHLGCVVIHEAEQQFKARFSCDFLDRLALTPPTERDHRLFWLSSRTPEVVVNTVERHLRYAVGPHVGDQPWHEATRVRSEPQPTPLFDATATPRVLAILGHTSAGDVWVDDLVPRGWTELDADVEFSQLDAALAAARSKEQHFFDVVLPARLRDAAERLNAAGVLPDGLRIEWV